MLIFAPPAFAGEYEKGISAYKRGNYAEAVALLKPLAQSGDPLAQFAIAVMYDDGRGMPQDFARALSWYSKAAHRGLVDAQYMMARFYGRGRGVKQNPSSAFLWFNIAGAGGHPDGVRLRDQHRHQITTSQQKRIEAAAVSWLERHPDQFTCKRRHCLYPRWLAKPRWETFGTPDIAPTD